MKTDEKIINECIANWMSTRREHVDFLRNSEKVYISFLQLIIDKCNQREQERKEELKKSINDLYLKFDSNLWALSNDVVCEKCEELVLKKIDEVFGK